MQSRVRHAGTDAQLLALLAASAPVAVGGLGAADLFLGDRKAWNSGEIPINALLSTIPVTAGGIGFGAYTLADPLLREQFLNWWNNPVFTKEREAELRKQGVDNEIFNKMRDMPGPDKPVATPDMLQTRKSFNIPLVGEVSLGTGAYQAHPGGTPGVSPKREAETKRIIEELYSTGKMPDVKIPEGVKLQTPNENVLNRRARNRMAVTALLAVLGGASAVNNMNSNERQSLS